MKKPGKELVIGLAGAALVIALTLIPGIFGTGKVDYDSRHGTFLKLLKDLGYKIGEPTSDETKGFLLQLRGGLSSDEEELWDGEAVKVAERTLARGGTVIAAGRPWAGRRLETIGGGAAKLELSQELARSLPDISIEVSVAFKPDSLPQGAKYLAISSLGPAIVEYRVEGGRLLLFADDFLFLREQILKTDPALLLNDLISPAWGKTLRFDGQATIDRRDLISRAVSNGAVAPAAAQAAALALLFLAGMAIRKKGVRGAAPPAAPSSLRSVEAIGAFYQKAGAHGTVDALLEKRFEARMARLSGAGGGGTAAIQPAGGQDKSAAPASSELKLGKLMTREAERRARLNALRDRWESSPSTRKV